MRLKVLEFKSFKENRNFKSQTCSVCGKKPVNAWRFKGKSYCSYNCMRIDEKKYLEKINAKLLDKDILAL